MKQSSLGPQFFFWAHCDDIQHYKTIPDATTLSQIPRYCTFQVYHFLKLGLYFKSVRANEMKLCLNCRYFLRQRLWMCQQNCTNISCTSLYPPMLNLAWPAHGLPMLKVNMGCMSQTEVKINMAGYGDVQISIWFGWNFHSCCRKQISIIQTYHFISLAHKLLK